MRTLFPLVSVPLTLVFFSSAQQPTQPGPLNLMPMPSNFQLTSDQMAIDQSFSVAVCTENLSPDVVVMKSAKDCV
jgi:hypothetical protein